jgi:PKD repeat protein
VHFDATGSRVQQGEIAKFIYNFWDGSKPYEGEGIVEYRYKNPGEYRVRVTAVTNDGKKMDKESLLIIKKPQETITISPSVSMENAQTWFPITFQVIVQWDVESVKWDFGDNTPQWEWTSVVHTFRTPGTFSVTARAEYVSGVEKIETILYQVK